MAYIFGNNRGRSPIREMTPVISSNSNLSNPFGNVSQDIGMRSFGGGPVTGGFDPRSFGGQNIPGVSRLMGGGPVTGGLDPRSFGGGPDRDSQMVGSDPNYNPNLPGVSSGSLQRRMGYFNPSDTSPGDGSWSLGQGMSANPNRSFRGTSGQVLSPFSNVMYQMPLNGRR